MRAKIIGVIAGFVRCTKEDGARFQFKTGVALKIQGTCEIGAGRDSNMTAEVESLL